MHKMRIHKSGVKEMPVKKKTTIKKPKTITLVRERSYGKDNIIVVKDKQEAKRVLKSGVQWSQASDEEYDGSVEEKRYYKQRGVKK